MLKLQFKGFVKIKNNTADKTEVIAKALFLFFSFFKLYLNFPLFYTLDKFRSTSPCLNLLTITLIVIAHK